MYHVETVESTTYTYRMQTRFHFIQFSLAFGGVRNANRYTYRKQNVQAYVQKAKSVYVQEGKPVYVGFVCKGLK